MYENSFNILNILNYLTTTFDVKWLVFWETIKRGKKHKLHSINNFGTNSHLPIRYAYSGSLKFFKHHKKYVWYVMYHLYMASIL